MSLKSVARNMSMIIPNVEEFVCEEHLYRKLVVIFNWSELTAPIRSCYSKSGRRGYAVEEGFRCLVLQFLEDKSDRQMEEFLKYDLSAKYFCSFGLTDKTPDHSYFGAFRARIGAHRLSTIFRSMVISLKKEGLIREFYSFVDASKIIACVDTW